MKEKYVERRVRSSGRVLWVVNPPKMIREAVEGAVYAQFERLDEANQFAKQVVVAYQDYRRGMKRQLKAVEGTVDGLFTFYKQSREYRELAPNSKKLYNAMLRDASSTTLGSSNVLFGEMLSFNVSPNHADAIFDTIQKLKSTHRATHVCKVLRKVWFVGLRAGKVRSNPFQKMGLKALDDRKVLWEPEQVERFIKQADEMGMSSIGTMALLCYDLCQRPGDMRQLTWSGYKNGYFEFQQEKTGTIVSIPASPRLVARIEGIKPQNAQNNEQIVLCEATGKPYDRRLYAKWAAKVRLAAGLPSTLQIRDLRRTGATEMAEAGCTEDELRAVTGHQSRDVLSIYVRPTVRLAAAGINKRFG
jgi:integrase